MDQQVKQSAIRKRFSIIIAAYNIEEYIERAIKSVEQQTFKNFELIIINDCSTDKTGERIIKYVEKYKNIIYISHDKNKKAGGARNTRTKYSRRGVHYLFRWRRLSCK